MKFNYIPLAFSLAAGVLATDPYGAPMPQTTSVKPMPTMPHMAPPAMTHPVIIDPIDSVAKAVAYSDARPRLRWA